MAKDKKGFMLYADQKEVVNELPDDIAGKLFKHIYSYVNDENPETDNLLIKVAFAPIKHQLKRDLKKYEAICKKNTDNIRKRWNKKDTTEYDRIETNTKHTDKGTDTDTGKDKIKHKYGEYSHVLLTDKQFKDLKGKVDDRNKWIKELDEAIEEKGNIWHIKNFYLAAIKWYKKDLEKNPVKSKKRVINHYEYKCPNCSKMFHPRRMKGENDYGAYRCDENGCQTVHLMDNSMVGVQLEFVKIIYKEQK